MNTVPTEFDQNGFHHSLVHRRGQVACYRRTRKGGKARHFETVIIRTHKESVIQTAKGPFVYPAGEHYPSSERWGTDGFTFNDEAAAMRKMASIEAQLSAK